MNVVISHRLFALMLKKLGGSLIATHRDLGDMGGNRYEIRQIETFDPPSQIWELIDHQAPIEETLTVVDALALPAPAE